MTVQTIAILYVIGAIPAGVWFAGIVYAAAQREFPSLAERDRYRDGAYAIVCAVFSALMWPVFLVLLPFILSGTLGLHGFLLPFSKSK